MSSILAYIQITAVGIVFGYGISTVIQVLTRVMYRNFRLIDNSSPELFLKYPLTNIWIFLKLFISAVLFLLFCYYIGIYIVKLVYG